MFTNTMAKMVVACLVVVVASLHTWLCRLLGRKLLQWEYWDHFGNANTCIKQAFIYSKADIVTRADKLHELVQTQRRKKNALTAEKVFVHSPHVLHYRHYPAEYKAFVQAFLQQALDIGAMGWL